MSTLSEARKRYRQVQLEAGEESPVDAMVPEVEPAPVTPEDEARAERRKERKSMWAKRKVKRGAGGGPPKTPLKRKSGGREWRIDVDADGQDGVLKIGKHTGTRLSQLAISAEGRGYMSWMLQQHKTNLLEGEEGFGSILPDLLRKFLGRPR